MTEEYEKEKQEELLSLLRKGKGLLENLRTEHVVDFTRYRTNSVAMKKIAERLVRK